MATTLYLILILSCVAIIIGGMRESARIYQFPFAAAAVFLGFVVFQLFGLLRAEYLPEWALERYIFMCILCLLMCWLGDLAAQRHGRRNVKPNRYDPSRWLAGATILVLVGGIAFLKNRSLFQEGFDMNTGITVAVNFFVTLLRYGFIMALIHFLRSKSKYALVLVLLAGLFYFDRIVLLGRRRDVVEFAFVLAGSAWFVLHRSVPRPVVIVGFALMTLFFFSMGDYRSIMVSRTGERDWSELQDLDLEGTFRKTSTEGSSETVAGIHLMAACAAEQALTLNFGANHWNGLVFNYIPAQVFGTAFKRSFYLPVPNVGEIARKRYGYVVPRGSTVTGMVDCFASFWYFGCLKFFAIAYIMQRLYLRAFDGYVIAQALYLLMMTMAMHAITHGTTWFVNPWVHVLVFWIPLMFYAQGRISTIRPEPFDRLVLSS